MVKEMFNVITGIGTLLISALAAVFLMYLNSTTSSTNDSVHRLENAIADTARVAQTTQTQVVAVGTKVDDLKENFSQLQSRVQTLEHEPAAAAPK